MVDEVNSLKQNGTWDLVRLPPGSVPIPCRFDFKVKRGRDGEVNRFKSRLVIQGFRQVYGIDYTESFSPVVHYSTLRILLAFAAALDIPIYHIDVKTAFLHAPLKKTIFMCQPEGFVDPDKPTYVCRLRKVFMVSFRPLESGTNFSIISSPPLACSVPLWTHASTSALQLASLLWQLSGLMMDSS